MGGGNRSGAIDVAATLTAKGQRIDFEVETFIAHTLRGEGFDASEDGTGRGIPLVPVAFSCKDHGADAADDISPTLRAMGHAESHANAGGQVAVAYDMRGREGGAQFEGPHDTANMRAASGGSSRSYVQQGWAVRRLMPVECARLQGFPDRHSQIPWRGGPAEECPDGPQYKTYGNSMAVKCMRWLGERIARDLEMRNQKP